MTVIEQEPEVVEVEVVDDPVEAHLWATLRCLERGGWCQGDMGNGYGEHCLYGAIVTTRRFSLSAVSEEAIVGLVYEAIPPYASWSSERFSIAAWNDAPERTFEDVRALLLSLIQKRRRTWQ